MMTQLKNELTSYEQPPYRFVPVSDIVDQSIEIEWLIEDYLPKRSVGMLYGPSGAGKSHIVLDMAVKIASGTPWCDKDTEQGVVLVMAGEGNSGLGRRLKSISKHHDVEIDEERLFFSERAIGIDTDKGFAELVSAIESLEVTPDLIIVDTLSRHLNRSSENSNEEMANFIDKLVQIKQRYDTSVMIVHHTGKNVNSGSRGASSIRANIDFSFELSQFSFEGHKLCEMKVEKQKDASDRLPAICFDIVTVPLGEMDSKGREINGACAQRVGFETVPMASRYEALAIETFDSDKSVWQKNFIEEVDEISDKPLKPASKTRIFREQVSRLVKSGLVKQLESKRFVKTEP